MENSYSLTGLMLTQGYSFHRICTRLGRGSERALSSTPVCLLSNYGSHQWVTVYRSHRATSVTSLSWLSPPQVIKNQRCDVHLCCERDQPECNKTTLDWRYVHQHCGIRLEAIRSKYRNVPIWCSCCCDIDVPWTSTAATH